MQAHTLFPTLLTDEFLSIDNYKLAEYANKLRAAIETEVRPGGWQSPWIDLAVPELQELLSAVNLHLDRLAKEIYNMVDSYTITVSNCWININEPSVEQLNNNYYHMHGGFFTSLVYYVDVEPETCGQLVLLPPHGFLDYALPFQLVENINLFTAQRFFIQPEIGKLVSFPSWINHFAESNKSTKNRISIALNASITPRT